MISITDFVYVLLFVLPGFVQSTVQRLFIPERRAEFSLQLPRFIGLSAIHIVIWFWFIDQAMAELQKNLTVGPALVRLIIVGIFSPVLLGVVNAKLIRH